MNRPPCIRRICLSVSLMAVALGLSGCGGSEGPAVEARAQSLALENPSELPLHGTITVSAQASSGLTSTFSTTTPEVCRVESPSGRVTALARGTCTVMIDQSGNATYAPAAQIRLDLPVIVPRAQTITFAPVPSLTLGGTITVSATATSELPVSYTSLSPTVCSVQAETGQVQSLTAGDCTIAADQPGDVDRDPAPRVLVSTSTTIPAGLTVPGVPTQITARTGSTADTVDIRVGSADSGGSPITSYEVRSVPAGVSGTSTGPAMTVRCPGSCAGRAFVVAARNAIGVSDESGAVDILTDYDVTVNFREPDTQPRDTIFTGRFTFNATTGEVIGLQGDLTESMTGTAAGTAPYFDMTRLTLGHQLSSVHVPALGGRLVTTFLNPDTRTFTTMAGGDGWSPEAGVAVGGIYFGFPVAASNPGNAYIRIFVPDSDPTVPLATTQIDKLAYADCAPGGMMGAACMTGTSVAGYGAVGTMSGYPVSQVISRRP